MATSHFNKKKNSTKVLQLLTNEAIFKKIYRRKREKFTVNYVDVTKIRKTRVVRGRMSKIRAQAITPACA